MAAMNKVFALLLRAVVGTCLIVAAPLVRAQEPTLLRVHHFLPTTSTIHARLIEPWCESLYRESAGRLKCQIHPAMQLGGTPAQLFDQARDGVVDVVWTLLGYSAGRFPLLEVFELPFMIHDAESASRALWRYASQEGAADLHEVQPLALHTHEAGHFFLGKRAVTQRADLRGLKIRAPTRQANRMLAALGASPVGMPVPQVADALYKGVIDGALLPYEVVPALKIHEVTRFASETDARFPALYTSVFALVMNKARYQGLPADLRALIDRTTGIELSARAGRLYDEAAERGRQAVRARGNSVNVIPPAELAQWRATTQTVVESWQSEVTAKGGDGARLLATARALIESERGKKTPLATTGSRIEAAQTK